MSPTLWMLIMEAIIVGIHNLINRMIASIISFQRRLCSENRDYCYAFLLSLYYVKESNFILQWPQNRTRIMTINVTFITSKSPTLTVPIAHSCKK